MALAGYRMLLIKRSDVDLASNYCHDGHADEQ